MTSFKLYTQTL